MKARSTTAPREVLEGVALIVAQKIGPFDGRTVLQLADATASHPAAEQLIAEIHFRFEHGTWPAGAALH